MTGISVRRRRTETFAAIPHTVARDSTLSDKAFRLWVVLQCYADWDDREAFPSIATLCADVSCARATIHRASDELVARGLLEIESGKAVGKANIYTVIDPPEGVSPTSHQVSHPRDTPYLTGDTPGISPTRHKQEPIELELVNETAGGEEELPRDHPDYGFERWWKRYPRRDGKCGSKTRAIALWRKMTYDEKAEAWRQLTVYLRVVAGGRLPMDAERFLRMGVEVGWNPAEGWIATMGPGTREKRYDEMTEDEWRVVYPSIPDAERVAAEGQRRVGLAERAEQQAGTG